MQVQIHSHRGVSVTRYAKVNPISMRGSAVRNNSHYRFFPSDWDFTQNRLSAGYAKVQLSHSGLTDILLPRKSGHT